MGIVEGHLSIVAPAEVELADGTAPAAAAYAKYPLIILGRNGKEITHLTADSKGTYRVTLPPGDYVLDVKGRAPGHVRARPQPFAVVANATVRVDLNIDTGVR